MPRKTTLKLRRDKLRRDKLRKDNRKQRVRKTRGGAGASDYMIQAAGNMGEQVAGHNGMLAYKLPTMGGGTGDVGMAHRLPGMMGGGNVNVASQAAGLAKHLNQMGGTAQVAVPVVLMLANQFAQKMLRGQRGGMQEDDNLANAVLPITKDINEPNKDIAPIGGGMLGTIAVPAALVLASNYFGKRTRRSAPKQNKYTANKRA